MKAINRTLIITILALLLPVAAMAKPFTEAQVPDTLKAWVPWVMYNLETRPCPFLHNNFDERICVWPSKLDLAMGDTSATFNYTIRIYTDQLPQMVPLPGQQDMWPQSVTVNDTAAVVIPQSGKPNLLLPAGEYKVSGEFRYDRMPAMLALPSYLGLVSLNVGGKEIAMPEIDGGNTLWIRRDRPEQKTQEEDRLEFTVFRHLVDDIPALSETMLLLDVAGKQREATIGKVLLENSVPMEITSELPARLEQDGTLKVQLRPGTWAVRIWTRHAGPFESITLPGGEKPLVPQEIWSVETHNHLRLVEVEGVPAIDPSQTRLPQEWQQFPAYLMQPGQAMKLTEKRRGMTDSVPDQLTLNRQLWLDFSGKGYTARDHINGVIRASDRIEVAEGMTLGRASIFGQDQYITKLDKGNPGIEVREGQIQLESDARMPATGELSATGWQHEFQRVETTLHLPPGWSLFAAGGADAVSSTWIKQWTLLDIFVVLIAVIAILKLLGLRMALLAAIGLVLLHPEMPGFTYTALLLLAAMALERTLPDGRLQSFARIVHRVTFVLLLLAVIPFMIEHLRGAIYPQLKNQISPQKLARDAQMGGGYVGNKDMAQYEQQQALNAPMPAAAPMEEEMRMNAERKEKADSLASSMEMDGGRGVMSMPQSMAKTAVSVADAVTPVQQYQYYTPDTKVQTGFGISSWEGNAVRLSWNGSVDASAKLSLWLISANQNLLLAIIRVILLAGITALLLGGTLPAWRDKLRGLITMLVLGVCILPLALPGQAMAQNTDYPPQDLLNQLQERFQQAINEQPSCLPDCASVSHVQINVQPAQLTLSLEVHADKSVAIPLPGSVTNWRPAAVLIDGQAAGALRTGSDGYLYAELSAGRHEVQLIGALPQSRDALGIAFPLLPHYATSAADGWEVQGIRENGIPDTTLQLVRTGKRETPKSEEAAFERTVLPPFFQVQRQVSFGTRWEVTTTVRRLTPTGDPVAVHVPLLPHETLTTPGIEVKQGKAFISMGAGDSMISWQGVIEPVSQLSLEAPKENPWVEVWRLDVSNLWHVTASGIPRVYEQNPATPQTYNVAPVSAQGIKQWQPWPGETLTLDIVRPEGIEGQTRTIDRSDVQVSVGKRSSDVQLTFSLRSSLGGQHEITLPEGAVLKEVRKNNLTLPIQQKGRVVSLPLTPGSQNFDVLWNQPETLSMLLHAPEINLGLPATVNAQTRITMPGDRWILFANGPVMGPAVLFWSWIPIILLASFVLARIPLAPLKSYHWFLLLLGMSQSSLAANFFVVSWLLALGWRSRLDTSAIAPYKFNFMQLIYAVWTSISLLSLLNSIQTGLLGTPDMDIEGNGSYASLLQWYQDITGDLLPQPLVLSVPVFAYRLLMLVWALWLAFSLVRWLQWGWRSFTEGGYWKRMPLPTPRPRQEHQQENEEE